MEIGLVSIIVPVYRVEMYLEQCLSSIVAQTYKNIEVYLIDDGSPDACPDICDVWARNDSRIHVIHQSNKGVSTARNRGMQKINGEFLAFVDSDDWLEPTMLEKLVQAINMSPEADAAFCGYHEVEEKSGEIFRTVAPSKNGVVCRNEGVAGIFGDYSTMLWNKLFRTKILSSKYEFDEKLKIGEDELWMIQNLKDAKNIALMSSPLYYYRNRKSGASKDYSLSNARLSEIDSQKKVLDEISSYGSDELVLLAQKRLYHSCHIIMKMAYYKGNYRLFKKIYIEINEGRKVWFANHTNLLGKCRRRITETMMRMHIPKRIILIFEKRSELHLFKG